MKARFALPVIVIALASAGAIVTANHDSPPIELAAHNNTVGHYQSHHDDIAFTDMSAHAAHHLGGIPLHEDGLESNFDWKADWELHTIDVIQNGHTVRIYHAINRRNPAIRFVAIWNTKDSTATRWEPAR